MWTLIVWGLVAIPAVGMLFVVADLFDAYRDLVIVRLLRETGTIEEEQARHTLLAQVARAGLLLAVAALAGFELADVLFRELTAAMVYVIALLGVGDAWRARRARKRMVAMLEDGDDDAQSS